MSLLSKLCCCFLLAIDLFVTVAFLVPTGSWTAEYNERVRKEGVVSSTAMKGYPKNIDSFYYNLAALVIPMGAFGFWYFTGRDAIRSPVVMWMIAVAWFIGLFSLVPAGVRFG